MGTPIFMQDTNNVSNGYYTQPIGKLLNSILYELENQEITTMNNLSHLYDQANWFQ